MEHQFFYEFSLQSTPIIKNVESEVSTITSCANLWWYTNTFLIAAWGSKGVGPWRGVSMQRSWALAVLLLCMHAGLLCVFCFEYVLLCVCVWGVFALCVFLFCVCFCFVCVVF